MFHVLVSCVVFEELLFVCVVHACGAAAISQHLLMLNWCSARAGVFASRNSLHFIQGMRV